MRRTLKAIAVLCLIVLVILYIKNHLFPFCIRIKEPFFAIPVQLSEDDKIALEIPIRNDKYGEGGFGAKRRGGRTHNGIDILAEMRRPVFAAKSGWAKGYEVEGGYGKLVVIEHYDGTQTRYGHLHEKHIDVRQWVWQGEQIGTVGKSGNANSKGLLPHLHFEIRDKGKPLDPVKELARTKSGG
ncbi:MAG: M23 family metallopeptidase [Candidatus Omnitrophota bacterium]